MSDVPHRHPDLVALATWLHEQRPALLAAWRESVGLDPHVTTAASLGRAQFIDHIPKILDAFELKLRARGAAEREAAAERQREGAADHGVHRWLHGYDSRETMREWGHLQRCLVDALERFALGPPSRDAIAMGVARRLLTDLFVDCIVESAVGHATLQETEAAGRLRDLEQVLESVRTLERDRAELWRQAAHDLRGNVGAVQLAATALARSAHVMPEASPAAAGRVQRSADLLARLLDDLIELARLEAGQERRHVVSFDAARLVNELCETLQPLAAERDLFLRVEAPASLPVQGDAIKVGRIAQNLLLNALKYTEHGGVQVTCAEVAVGEVPSWVLCVQDTGVGFGHGRVTPLALVISDATEEAQTMARDAASRATASGATPAREAPQAVPMLRSQSDEWPPEGRRSAGGEGIGLAIVKRLCELLDASLELQSEPGRGTTFRIVFPKRY